MDDQRKGIAHCTAAGKHLRTIRIKHFTFFLVRFSFFKGIAVNRAVPSLHGGALKITRIWILSFYKQFPLAIQGSTKIGLTVSTFIWYKKNKAIKNIHFIHVNLNKHWKYIQVGKNWKYDNLDASKLW